MKVAEPTIERLIEYYRLLVQLKENSVKVVSSLQIGEMLGVKASQVRKDLSYFGEIGKRGVGYHVNRLYSHIEGILASPKVWKIALAGVGNLGMALLAHKAFQSRKFAVDALFDVDPGKVGRDILGVPCWHVNDMARVMDERGIEVMILAVPAAAAQSCIDQAVSSKSLKGIMAFTPASVVVPDRILFYRVDIFVELEKILFFLKEREKKS